MSKKNKNKAYSLDDFISSAGKKSKKKLNKDFKNIVNEIEESRMLMFEADKRSKTKSRRAINLEAQSFYTNMDSIKCRKKIAKEWEKNGFLDRVLELINESAPFVKTLAKLVATLILTFLSFDCIKKAISPKMLKKLAMVFDIAMCI